MVGLHQILDDNVITFLEPLMNCQCGFKFWGSILVALERNILLRLRSHCN